jgi:hypothetical protein
MTIVDKSAGKKNPPPLYTTWEKVVYLVISPTHDDRAFFGGDTMMRIPREAAACKEVRHFPFPVGKQSK